MWCSDVGPDEAGVCLRVREGGEVLDRIELDCPCYACMLGGEDGPGPGRPCRRAARRLAMRLSPPDRLRPLRIPDCEVSLERHLQPG